MTCSRLFSRSPRLFGVRCLLSVLLIAAGLAGASCKPREPTHSIEDVAAGDFVRAVVEQKADVRVELIGPDGRVVVHVDGPNRTRDAEELAAVVELAGDYRLRVLNCPVDAPPDDCYTLRTPILVRPATAQDRLRAQAVRTDQDAAELMVERTEASLRSQRETRERALALWRRAGDRRREARELVELGIVQRLLFQAEPAAQRLHEAARIYAALRDPAGEARALNEAGMTCETLGNLEEGLKDYQQALAKARQAGDRELRKNILNNLGLLLNARGERREALVHLNEARRVAQELGGQGVANILNSLGFTYSDLGETQKAIKLHNQVLDLVDATPFDRATAFNNLGAIHFDLGNWEEAIQNYNDAIKNLQDDPFRLASTLNNLAVAQQSSGNFEKARASYEKALALAKNNVEVQMRSAYSYGLLLNQKLGRPAEAVRQWRKVVQLAAEHPILAHYGLAARALIERGENRLAAARETLPEAIRHSERRAELRFAADLTLRLARIERELGDLPAAAEHAREAVERIEALRNRVASLDQRALFLASSQTFYEIYIRLLMELDQKHRGEGYDARALAVSEQARARSLLDLLGEAEAGLRRGVPQKILEAEQKARARLRETDLHHMELIHQGASRDQIAQASGQLRDAVEDFEEVEASLRESSESYAALTGRPLNVREIQKQVLGDRTLLLEYALGEERSYLWAVTSGRVQSFALPPRRAIEAAARNFYTAITERNDSEAERAGLALSRMILGPVEGLLGDHILLVVGDGALQYVPFIALPLPSIPDRRVLAHNEVVSLPSASTLAALRRQIQGRPPAPKTLVALADPVFRGDRRTLQFPDAKSTQGPQVAQRGPNGEEDQLSLPPLPFAEEEANDILELVPARQRLGALGFDASYPLATSKQMAEFRYIHFATHGLLDSRQPKLSKLALSQYDKDGRRRKESFLRLADIYNLELNADLVVLSACKTAQGKEVPGEGLIGLTRGFMYAGAPRVLASLWSVEDRATAKLMTSFYRHLIKGKLPAPEALRRAQMELAADPLHRAPYYWAGFSLQGEWK